MEIREYNVDNGKDLLCLYASVGWTAYTENPILLEAGVQNSLLTLGAYEGKDLIGLIRAVGDGYTILYIQDILVKPEYQRRGIGTSLIRSLLDRYADVRQILLMTDDTPGTAAFYRSLGFARLEQIGCCGFIKATESS